jgi:hypothetical protein
MHNNAQKLTIVVASCRVMHAVVLLLGAFLLSVSTFNYSMIALDVNKIYLFEET